jgi:hydroxypyruvate isomerase
MPRFSANISMMFTEVPPLERFAAARAAGFKAVEWQLPYAFPVEEVKRAKEHAGVEIALINFPMGDPAKGDRGLAALPDRADELKAGIEKGRRYAEILGVKRMNLLPGVVPAGVEPARARETLLNNLRVAARTLAEIGGTVCMELINTIDTPGFFVSRPDAGIDVLDACGEKNIALQYDFYHMQRMGEDLTGAFAKHVKRIGHVQFADVPGRHEPGSGGIDFKSVFAAIDRTSYDGWVGAEYNPSRKTTETLDWFAPYRSTQ